jgi:pantoate--beta-alanine ligase
VAGALNQARTSLAHAGFTVDYIALVDADTLVPLDAPQGGMRLIAALTICLP